MSGHSHWAGIKHKKGAKDAKKGILFSKLLNVIAIAAKTEPNPEFNPRLRTAIQKAKENNVPQDKIETALKKAASKSDNLEELLLEAYGPGGVAILIEAISDNKNRTVSEIKKILSDEGAKWAEPGSVKWIFSAEGGSAFGREQTVWKAKFLQDLDEENKTKLKNIISALEDHDDVQKVQTNTPL